MDMPKLLHTFAFTPNRKTIVAGLPEVRRSRRLQLARGDLLEHLNDDGECVALRFADEQMNVFGHYHITGDVAAVPAPNSFEFALEGLSRCNRIENRHATITAGSYETLAPLLLIAFGLRSHCDGILIPNGVPPSRKKPARRVGQPKMGKVEERLVGGSFLRAPSAYFQPYAGENIGLPLAVAEAGTSSGITSQCSTTLPSFTSKISTATIGFGPQPT